MSEQNDEMIGKLGDQEVSLAQLAGFDMSNVDAKRFENLPDGWHFKFEVVGDPMPDVYLTQEKGKFKTMIPCKVLDVIAFKGDGDPEKLIGKLHQETNMLNSADSLGYALATIEDLGCNQKGPLRNMLHSLVGTKFTAFIKHTPDKNDSDKVYANLRKITILEKPEASSVAGSLAA